MTVFLDTSFYIAFLLPRDQWFKKAVKAARTEFRSVTSNLVVNETVAFLQARSLLSTAHAWLQGIRADPVTQILYVDAALQAEAWDLFHRWGGSGANPVDCASFAIMRRMNIRRAFTFDEHFHTAGFETLR